MKLRTRIISDSEDVSSPETDFEDLSKSSSSDTTPMPSPTMKFMNPNNNFLQLNKTIQENIINSIREINIQTIEKQKSFNNQILESIKNMTDCMVTTNNNNKIIQEKIQENIQKNFQENMDFIRKKNYNKTRNTFFLFVFSLVLSITTSYISVELSKQIILFVFSLPFSIIDTIFSYSIGNFISYDNYFINKIETFSLPTHIKNIEYISHYYVSCILTIICYCIFIFLRFITNVSNGQISICITPLSINCCSNDIMNGQTRVQTEEVTLNANNILNENSNETNIKNICNTIKELYQLEHREKNIISSINY